LTNFADELRKKTTEAIEAGKTLARLKHDEEVAQDKARLAAEHARGAQMKAGIESACSAAAALGKNSAKVAKLNKYNFGNDGGSTVIDVIAPDNRRDAFDRSHLGTAAAIAWDRIIELGMEPFVKWNHDGMGQKDWYELWASWEDEK